MAEEKKPEDRVVRDKVAKAIFHADWGEDANWLLVDASVRDACRRMADAALAELTREG